MATRAGPPGSRGRGSDGLDIAPAAHARSKSRWGSRQPPSADISERLSRPDAWRLWEAVDLIVEQDRAVAFSSAHAARAGGVARKSQGVDRRARFPREVAGVGLPTEEGAAALGHGPRQLRPTWLVSFHMVLPS